MAKVNDVYLTGRWTGDPNAQTGQFIHKVEGDELGDAYTPEQKFAIFSTLRTQGAWKLFVGSGTENHARKEAREFFDKAIRWYTDRKEFDKAKVLIGLMTEAARPDPELANIRADSLRQLSAAMLRAGDVQGAQQVMLSIPKSLPPGSGRPILAF